MKHKNKRAMLILSSRTIPFVLLALFMLQPLRAETHLLDGLKIPQLEFDEITPETRRLPGGATLLRADDPSLPFVTLEFHFNGGENAGSKEHPAASSALVKLLDIDGAGKRSGKEVAKALSGMGAQLSIAIDYEEWVVSLTVLKSDFDRAFAIVSDILLEPALSQENLHVVQDSMTTEIRQRNDDPATVLKRKIYEVLYPGMMKGYTIQQKDIDSLTPDLLRVELHRRLRAGGLYVSASGDTKGLNLEQKLSDLISRFPKQTEKLSIEALPQARSFAGSPIYLIDVPASQTVIAVTRRIVPHNHPDFFALQTGNYILGGGSFLSRLMREIRTKRGLAYYAYSRNQFFANDGNFVAACGTQTEKAAQTLRILLGEIDTLRDGITGDELSIAKDAILNSLVFEFDDPAKITQNEIRFRRHKMPEHYLSIFPEKIRNLSKKAILDAAATYLDSSTMAIVIAGPAGKLKSELETIRPVRVIQPEEIGFIDTP